MTRPPPLMPSRVSVLGVSGSPLSGAGPRPRQPAPTCLALLVALGALLQAGQACAQPLPEPAPPEPYMEAGRHALSWTRKFVELGPRPAGSAALAAQRDLIVSGLSGLSCEIEVDEFVAATPVGALRMGNVFARFGPSDAPQVVVVSGHYDTAPIPGFVGANDGGSSAGLLMALAERIHATRPGPVWLAFFDGEESTVEWRNNDHTYGSRRTAARWAADGTAERVRALINVDMIGDADLQLLYEGNSTAHLRDAIWAVAGELGYEAVFSRRLGYIEDDHIPFLGAGVPSLNLIDFDYGPRNSYWHTTEDSIDKLHPRSLATVLHVLEAGIGKLLGN